MSRVLLVRRLGRLAYLPAMTLMEEVVRRRTAGEIPDTLLVLEHEPVITCPPRSPSELLLADPQTLRQSGIEVHPTSRGGLITYHGPGQLVAYPVLDLRPDRCDLHRYLRDLEEVILRVLARLGIQGTRRPGLTGVWVGTEKVAALGVRVSRWITSHGLALNVGMDLTGFDSIIPCGLRGAGVTSCCRLAGRPMEVDEVASLLVPILGQVFERVPQEEDPLPTRQIGPLEAAKNPGPPKAASEDP